METRLIQVGFALAVAGCAAAPRSVGDGSVFDLASGGADLAAPDLAPARTFVYVGGYAPDLSIYELLPGGVLSARGSITAGGSPSFIAVDAWRRRLFAIDESGSLALAFTIDPTTGLLTANGQVPSGGAGPAHVEVSASGSWVLVANYGDGTAGVLRVGAGGTLGSATVYPAGAMAHQIVLDPAERHVWVPCLGADYIAQYDIAPGTGALTPAAVARVSTPAGSGPRHLALAPSGAFAYVMNELASTMTAYSVASGSLTRLQTVSTLPPGTTAPNTGAEVQVHPSGRFLYGSNRGDDSIVIFSLDASGRMTPIGYPKTGGQTPRGFTLDPSGRFLLVANQGSNQVVVFSVDAVLGTLTPAGGPVTVTAPATIGVLTL